MHSTHLYLYYLYDNNLKDFVIGMIAVMILIELKRSLTQLTMTHFCKNHILQKSYAIGLWKYTIVFNTSTEMSAL